MSEVKYPCLMKNTRTGLIIMMESANEYGDGVGEVVGSGNGNSNYQVGDRSTMWDMVQFKLYKGGI